jgi:hypothetical protein
MSAPPVRVHSTASQFHRIIVNKVIAPTRSPIAKRVTPSYFAEQMWPRRLSCAGWPTEERASSRLRTHPVDRNERLGNLGLAAYGTNTARGQGLPLEAKAWEAAGGWAQNHLTDVLCNVHRVLCPQNRQPR